MKAHFFSYTLNFKRPSGTSRGIMTKKETWFIVLKENGKIGIGECGILRGLSHDDKPDYSDKLQWTCDNIHLGKNHLWKALREYPSIQFGIEQAFLSLASKDPMILFDTEFTKGQKSIPINGLIWMGKPEFMKAQIDEKIKDGFGCIKLKIGAIYFEKELKLLAYIRQRFSPEKIEIRVDANGSFDKIKALDIINQLSEYQIHSIEQPIQKNNTDTMSVLCKNTPLPIVLDEELIGITKLSDKKNLLQKIKPQYIILKPSLVGGFKGSEEWISVAEKLGIKWWITSALESNIGLNAIAQWTFTLGNNMHQGLGTGELYTNNIDSPLMVKKGHLWYNNNYEWALDKTLNNVSSA